MDFSSLPRKKGRVDFSIDKLYLESSTNKLYAMTMWQCPRDNILYVFIYIQNERKLCE